MRPLVVISKENIASQNIKENLMRLVQFERQPDGRLSSEFFDMAEYSGSIVEIVPAHDADYYIFASTHKSSSNTPSFTVHAPGNWGAADLGGRARTLNIAYASKMKVAARKMKELSDASLGWQVAMEVVHHGPSLEKPVLFAEIGSTENEWKNEKAGEIAAKAIIEAAKSRETFETYVGFGGSHYAPKFTPKILDSEIAFGNVVSGYALEREGCDEEMARQAFEKNVEKIEAALIDWKGMKGESRAKLVALLDSAGLPWKKA